MASVTVTQLLLCLPQNKQSQNSVRNFFFFFGPLGPEDSVGADEGSECNPPLCCLPFGQVP